MNTDTNTPSATPAIAAVPYKAPVVTSTVETQVPRIAATPLATAVQTAMTKTDPSKTPLSDHILRELSRGSEGPTKRDFPSAELNIDGRRPMFNNEKAFIEWMQLVPVDDFIVKNWDDLRAQAEAKFLDAADAFPVTPDGLMTFPMYGEGALCTCEEYKALRSIQSRIDDVIKRMEPFALGRVSDRIQVLRDEAQAKIAMGEDPDPGSQLIPSRDAVSRDSRERLAAYEKFIIKITQAETVPLVKTILTRFEKMVAAFMRRTEMEDREACLIQGIEFHPSIQWKCAAQIAMRYAMKKMPESPSWQTPKQLLANIVEL
jgi:hypothetical protein